MREAKTAEQQQKAAEKMPKLEKFAPRFLELAEKNSGDPVVLDALIWIATNMRGGGATAERGKALDLLMRDHIESDKLDRVCETLAFGYGKQDEVFLRSVLAKSKTKSTRAEACLALAQGLQRRSEMAKQMSADPNLAMQFENIFGKEGVAELKRVDPEKLLT